MLHRFDHQEAVRHKEQHKQKPGGESSLFMSKFRGWITEYMNVELILYTVLSVFHMQEVLSSL